MTDAERKLWRQLRELELPNTHFRKQVPIGRYIADFCCHTTKLIIEVDGGQHNENKEVERDKVRTDWLQSQGYRVLRFWNNEVLNNTEGVMETILDVIENSAPPPQPLPTRGRGFN